MKVIIYQRGGDKLNIPLYEKAVNFFVDELIPKNKQDITIQVKLKQFTGSCKSTWGNCEQLSPNKFIIEINKASNFADIITTLAHELVHVKQFISGKLQYKNAGPVWKGKLYKNVDNATKEEYNNLEWEKESLSLEPVLTKKFFTKYLYN